MSEPSSTFARVEKAMRDVVAFDGGISAETRFVDELSFDALDIIELSIAIEETFDVELLDDDLESVATVGDLVQLVERRVAGR